jgi:hypothetical protein
MKTFIWNREYQVLAANCETVEQARLLLKPVLDAMLDPEFERDKARAAKYLAEVDPTTVPEGYYRDAAWWERNLKNIEKHMNEEKAILLNDPDVIIEENQAMFFDHYNE